MASAEDYAAWIVQNADKKGTPEFETVSQAYQVARGQGGATPVAAPVNAPSAFDYLRANPVLGTPIQGLIQGGQGLEQLGARGIDALAGTNLAPGVDKTTLEERQAYRGARDRVNAASTNPRLSEALQGTGEAMGGMLNPAGMAGRLVPAIRALGPTANAFLQGLVGGGAYGASQPVTDTANYGTEKAAQIGLGAATGGPINAGAHLLMTPKAAPPPTTDQLKQMKTQAYRAVSTIPVPVTPKFLSALDGQTGRDALNLALKEADANRDAGLIAELNSLKGTTPPTTISADAADKISQALSGAARAEIRNPTGSNNVARGLSSRRADVETSLAAVPQLKDARELNARWERSKIIDETIQDATDRNRTPAGAGGIDQSMRREFGKLITSKEFDSFSQEEQDAIKKVANGTLTANTLQRLSKFSPVRNHLAAFLELSGAAGGGSYMGAEGAALPIGMALGGEAARQGSEFATKRAAQGASELMRRGSQPLAPLPQTSGLPIGNWATSLLLQPLLKQATP